MPIYSYVCKACKKAYDYFHLGTQDKVAKCPHCGSLESEKQATAPDHVINGASAKNNYGLKRGF
jgi:putative FmdB family regulatory protein